MSLHDLNPKKKQLLSDGKSLIGKWCVAHLLPIPKIVTYDGKPTFATCAYYRDNTIHIWPKACAAVGRAGQQWSYPGYTVDRTPYGVLAHETGHYSDKAHGTKGGTFSHIWIRETEEEAISGYCPNSNEWYAEMFRVFLTNPDLLKILRPKTFAKFFQRWPIHIETRGWEEVLAGSPRHIRAVRNKITALGRKSQR